MNKDKKCHSLVFLSLLTIFSTTVFTFVLPSQKIFASGITIYSPYWMNYEKDLKSPYFESCGIFDSCLSNDIRIFPFLPLATHTQSNDNNNNISPRNTVSSIIPFHTHTQKNDNNNNISPRNTVSSIIPFQLPFP